MKLFRNVIFVVALIGIVLSMDIYTSRKTTTNKSESLEAAPTNLMPETPIVSKDCPFDELKLNSENGKTVNEIIKDNCLLASVIKLSDGKTLIDGVGYGCGSCHANSIYILKADKVIFQYEGDDSVLSETSGGFQIREPIRKDGEPLCCAEEFAVKRFQYDETQNSVKEIFF